MCAIDRFKNYEMGIPEFDEQHHQLIGLVDELHKHIKDDDHSEMVRLMDELISFASYHFSFEISYFREKGFPYIEYHEKVHHELLLSLNKIRYNLRFEKYVDKYFTQTIEDLLYGHVDHYDMQYVNWLQNHKH